MSALAGEDYYELLGVGMYASDEEVYEAFKSLRAMYSLENPDALNFFSETELKELRQILDKAYLILSNPLKRPAYNEFLKKKYPDRYGSAPTYRNRLDASLQTEIMNKDKFDGLFLKKIREHIGLDVYELSGVTRIKTMYIKALEENDFDTLPAPVFVRGFVAQISKVFGLDEKRVCQSYMNFYRDQKG